MNLHLKSMGVAVIFVLGVLMVFWMRSISESPIPPATDAECKKVFDDSLQDIFGPEMDDAIKRCSGRLEPLVAGVHSNYRIVGNSLQIGDSIYSAHGMVVQNSASHFRDLGLTIPNVRVSVSDKNISLLFGHQADADKAFAEIGALIANSKN